MLKSKRFYITAVTTLAALSLGAAPALATKPPPPYKGIGKPSPNTQGQTCFISSWAGNGGWATHDIFKNGHSTDSSVYSWDETTSNSTQGVCGFLVLGGILGIPYSIEASGFVFNSGTARLGVNVDEMRHPENEPPETNKCSDAKTVPVGNSSDGSKVFGSSYTVTKQHASLVFTVTLNVPSNLTCNPQYFPGAFPANGGSWYSASSVPVPDSVFEHSAEVMVTVSADPSHKPGPNCGLPPDAGSCSDSGAWQGELTFKHYHG